MIKDGVVTAAEIEEQRERIEWLEWQKQVIIEEYVKTENNDSYEPL